MSESPLRSQFRNAYRNLVLRPLLEPEEVRRFKVPYGENVLAELEQKIDFAPPGSNNKMIFTGHQGCGKSTLLGELSRNLKAAGYFSVFFSIADLVERSDIDHIKILFAIAVQLMATAEAEKIEIPQDARERFDNWFAIKTQVNLDQKRAELGAGFDLFKIVRGKMQVDATIRQEIKKEFERNISELVDRINEIADIIADAAKKDIVVIIDDLDKLDIGDAREIFSERVKALFQPQFCIVYTIPIAVLREIDIRRGLEMETNNQLFSMSVSKLYDRDSTEARSGDPIVETIDTLSRILLKRIENPDLVELKALESIIRYSGGVLREVIRIASECCSECGLQLRMEPERTDVKITPELVEKVATEFRVDLATPLTPTDYKILVDIYKEQTQKTADDREEQKFLDLLHGLYILEYRNGDVWYDVHPLVVPLLYQRGWLLA